MKKGILAVLIILMVAIPSLAQEVEPDGLFSINGTLWSYDESYFGVGGGGLYFIRYYLGFHDGTVYYSAGPMGIPDDFLVSDEAIYLDFIAFSIFFMRRSTAFVGGVLYPAIGVGLGFDSDERIVGIWKVSDTFEPN